MITELALYPAVALLYFFGMLRASQQDRVELDERAQLNVFCLFVVGQPLCFVIGGYAGMATYLMTALVSYWFMPWREGGGARKEGVQQQAKEAAGGSSETSKESKKIK